MRPIHLVGLAAIASLVTAAPLRAQEVDPDWHLEGLQTGFCIQLLLDPASDVLDDLPSGFRILPASATKDLHASLHDVITGQTEFASWAPSRLCFEAVDTIRTSKHSAHGKRGRPLLFGLWTVKAAGATGEPTNLMLRLYTSSGSLEDEAKKVGLDARGARLWMGKVPIVDENGVPSPDDRFEVKVGKTVITWDGRLASDTARLKEPIRRDWTTGKSAGGLTLDAEFSRSMVGALKVDGKDAFAKALRASPTRFAGPAYEGGRATVSFKP